jgi:MYND finger
MIPEGNPHRTTHCRGHIMIVHQLAISAAAALQGQLTMLTRKLLPRTGPGLSSTATWKGLFATSVVVVVAVGGILGYRNTLCRHKQQRKPGNSRQAGGLESVASTSVLKQCSPEELAAQSTTELQCCSVCLEPSQHRCAACHRATYCSRLCQQRHWGQHRKACPGRYGSRPQPGHATAVPSKIRREAALLQAFQRLTCLQSQSRHDEQALQECANVSALAKHLDCPLASLHAAYIQGTIRLRTQSFAVAQEVLQDAVEIGQRLFQGCLASGQNHRHDDLSSMLKPSSCLTAQDACIVGECMVGLSYSERKLGHHAAAVCQGHHALALARQVDCSHWQVHPLLLQWLRFALIGANGSDSQSRM